VPEPDLVAIAKKDNRIDPIFRKKSVGVLRRLPFPHERITAGALRFHNRQQAT